MKTLTYLYKVKKEESRIADSIDNILSGKFFERFCLVILIISLIYFMPVIISILSR